MGVYKSLVLGQAPRKFFVWMPIAFNFQLPLYFCHDVSLLRGFRIDGS